MSAGYGSQQPKTRLKIASIKPRIATLDTRVGSSSATERIRGREHDRIRQRILARDGGVCTRCGIGIGKLVVDHIIPIHLGGAESDENRKILCVACHKLKSDAEEKERR